MIRAGIHGDQQFTILCSPFLLQRQKNNDSVFCLMANFLTRQDKLQNVKAEL